MNLIDTSVLIDDLRAGRRREGCISVITLIEVLRGLAEEKRERVKRLLEEAFDVVALDNPVVNIYCRLYSQLGERGISLADSDILIAASAIARDLELLTKDKGFDRLIDLGLRLAPAET